MLQVISFARTFGDKYDYYSKNLMNTTAKTVIEAGKTSSKRVVRKTAEVTDLIENKIADKLPQQVKQKVKKKKTKQIKDRRFDFALRKYDNHHSTN